MQTVPEIPINIEPLKEQAAIVKEQLKRPVPTALLPSMVLWYDRAEVKEGAGYTAVVTRIESPGKLSLTVFKPNAMPVHKTGVLHVSDPIHQKRNNPNSTRNGAWAYPDWVKIPKEHYEPERKRLQDRLDAINADIARLQEMRDRQEQAGTAKSPLSAENTAEAPAT